MEEKLQKYKPAKTINEQLKYLNEKKRVQFNQMNEETAGHKLLKYNYINVITPFKHKFAKLDDKKEVIKINGNHVYEGDVDFKEYYDFFINGRKQYPIIVANILNFEIHFKTIISYNILTGYEINDSNELKLFLDNLKKNLNSSLQSKFNCKRIGHMEKQLNNLKEDIFRYADIYCFFDRMSLGNMLTIFTCLDEEIQNKIFAD